MQSRLKKWIFFVFVSFAFNSYAEVATFKKETIICFKKENMEYIIKLKKSFDKDKEELPKSIIELRGCVPLAFLNSKGKWMGEVEFEKIEFENSSAGRIAKLGDGSDDAMYVAANNVLVVKSEQPAVKSTRFDENTCVAAALGFRDAAIGTTEGGARAYCQSSSTRKDNRYWSCMRVKANAGESLGSASASCQ